jgi:uncharacterized membrane protein YphA (DoxX/SURF4 family)
MIQVICAIATGAEIVLAILLLVGFKTEGAAKLSGLLLLFFGLAMTFSTGVKGAFALSLMKEKYFEIDAILLKKGGDLN